MVWHYSVPLYCRSMLHNNKKQHCRVVGRHDRGHHHLLCSSSSFTYAFLACFIYATTTTTEKLRTDRPWNICHYYYNRKTTDRPTVVQTSLCYLGSTHPRHHSTYVYSVTSMCVMNKTRDVRLKQSRPHAGVCVPSLLSCQQPRVCHPTSHPPSHHPL